MTKTEEDVDIGSKDIQYSGLDRALFGTLFAMCKGDESSSEESWVDWGPLIFEFLQCIGLPIQEIWQWPMGPTMPFIMEILDMMDFQFFTATPAMSYALITVLSTVVLSSIFVFIALLFVFKNGDSQVPLFLVRLLRLVTNACVTWGYQPFITIIFMIVDCHWVDGVGYTDVHPEVLCWSGPQLAFNILALITLVAFIPFTQFVILFLYDFDCKHDILLSAFSGRYEFIEMLFKCVITAQSQWVSTYTHFRCVTCIAGFGFLMFYIMWMQPYHSLHSNVWASSQYVPTVASSVYAWISVFTEGSNNLVIAFFWTTFFFFCIFGTWVLALYARQIYLSRLAITYNFRIPVKPGINFRGKDKPFYTEVENVYYSRVRGFIHEKPKEPQPLEQTSSTIPYQLYKLKHVSHIDQAVRFLWRPEVRKRKEYIEFADAIYKTGFTRFPRHPGLHIHYALFLTHYKKDWEGCMKHMKIAFKLGATIDNRWIIYFMDKVYEQENSGADLKSADVMSLFRYKNHLSQAEQNQRDAREKLTTVLSMLENKDDDVGAISLLLDELIDNEKESEFHFKALLQTHPFSIPVLRGYANLLTDIFRNDAEAQLLYDRANEIEAEMIKLDPRGYRPQGRKKGTKNNIGSRKAKSGAEEEQRVASDIWFGFLKYGSPVTVVIFLGLGIVIMLLSLDNTRDVADNIGILKDMATAETLVNELTYYVKLYEIYHFNLGTLDPAIYPTFQETLDSLQEKSRELHNIAIIKLFKTDSQFLVWHQAELTYFTTIHDSGVFSYQYQSTQTLINAANGYATELYQLSGLTGSFKEDTLRDIITQTMMNGPTSLDQKFKKMICDLVMALASQNTTRMLLIIAIGVIGLVIAVAITAIVYFLLTRLNKQRNAALSFLISIKPDVLGNIQTRLTNSAELDNQEKKRAEIRKDWKSTLAAARGSLAPGMFKRPSFNQQFPGMDLQPIQGENSIEVPAHKRRKSIFAPGMLTNANSLLHNRQVSIGVHGMPLFKELSVSDEGSLPTAPIHNRRASLLMRPPAHRRGQSTPFANPADNPDQEPGFHPAPAHNRRLSIQPILPGDSTDGGMRILPQHSRAPSFAIQPSESQGHPIEGGQSLALGDELTKGSTPAQTSRSIAIKEEALKDTSEEHLDQQSINSLPKLTIPDVTELKKKKIFQNAVPPGLIASALVAYVLLLVGLLANVIVSIATTFFMQAWPVRVGLAGIRAASAQLVPFLALQVAFPEAGVKDADVVLRSSPGWTGLEHMSSSQEEVLKVFSAYQTYITNLHNLCRFGEMPPMGDSVIDPVVVYDMLTVKSVQSLLFEPDTCFLKDKSICSQKPDRMPTTGLANGVKLYGVEAMMQLLRKAMRAIEMYNSSYSDPRVISPNHHPAAYINTALRYDLKDGLARITEDIANESSTVYLTQTVLIIVFSVLNFALIVLLFFYLIVKVQSQLNHVAFKTKRIQQLIPLEETMAIRWSKAFNLGEAKLDDSHRLILDAASTLLDNLIKNEEKQLGQQAQIVHAFLHRHQKEEIKWINQSQHPDADVLCSRIQDVTKQYSLLLRKYEQGYDITHAMSTLFNYFIDVHIMEENRRTLEWVKEQKIIQGDS